MTSPTSPPSPPLPPRVSIIIPTYNFGHLISGAVESVLAQTYSRVEIIVVDSGNDDTREVLAPYIEQDKVRYYFQEPRGVSAARNFAMGKARGEYIGFLDADDRFLPEKIARQVAFLDAHPRYGLVFSNYRLYYAESGRVSEPVWTNQHNPITRVKLLRRNQVGTTTVLLRKAVFEDIGGFDETIFSSEDYEYWLRVVTNYPIWYMENALALYTLHEDMDSADFEKVNRHTIKVLHDFAATTRLTAKEWAGLRKNIIYSLTYLVRKHLLEGDYRRVLSLLLHGFKIGGIYLPRVLLQRVLTFYRLSTLYYVWGATSRK